MSAPYVRNTETLATTPLRCDALALVQAGLEAIDTTAVVQRQVHCDDHTLTIAGQSFDLTSVKRLYVIGFGKASCQAAAALEHILGSRIHSGLVIGNTPAVCEVITTHTGTHPKPSPQNVDYSEQMLARLKDMQSDDMVLVVVSGGGSALLCWPQAECDQGQKLYEASVRTGITIGELNTVRKHISSVKGGGLASMLWPARVVGLVFSDVPGHDYHMVASGPTYLDTTTVGDAQDIITRYGLGSYQLQETPKESKYFERVANIVLVSNAQALEAMATRATALGYQPTIVSDSLYDEPQDAIDQLLHVAGAHTVALAGGEFRLTIPAKVGEGGRNTRAALVALERIAPADLFVALASDGIDNGDVAGAIADVTTREHAQANGVDVATALTEYDDRTFFKKTGDALTTGPTDANVSDLMFLVRP